MMPRSSSVSGSSLAHRRRSEPHRVERADQVDAHHAVEIGKRHRPLAADDALRRADAGAVDEDARRAVVGGGLGDRRLGAGAVGDVAVNGDAVDVDRGLGGDLLVDVEERHLGAGLSQHARGGGAEAGASAGNECCVSANIHDQLPCAAAMPERPATMTLAGGGSA